MRTLSLSSAALAALSIGLLSGCPVLSAEAEIGEMCVTFKDRTIKGTAAGQPFRHSVIAEPFEVFPALLQFDMEISHARATLILKQGAEDFSFLESISVYARGVEAGNELPPVALVNCPDYLCASDGGETSFDTDVPGTLGDYVAAGAMQLDITLRGPLPETDFTVDIEVCVSGLASVALEL